MSDPIIKLEAVTKTYRSKKKLVKGADQTVVALKDVSLDISRGDIYGLVGQSGSGKTTTGRLIVKLEPPTAGRLLLDGKDITEIRGKHLAEYRRKVQMIFQDPYQSLNPYFSIFDTVSEPLIIHSMGNRTDHEEIVFEALQSVGLSPPEDFFYRYPHELSGGQRQRVAIARAVVLKPEFVVADEPTSMLDASISIQIFSILQNLQSNMGVTFLFITHSLAAAWYLCNRIAVIYKGEIVETGSAEDVIKHPRHEYTRALIKAQPKFGKGGSFTG